MYNSTKIMVHLIVIRLDSYPHV